MTVVTCVALKKQNKKYNKILQNTEENLDIVFIFLYFPKVINNISQIKTTGCT